VPVPAVDRRRRHQKGVFLPVIRYALADDVGGVADRFRRRQDLEVGQGKIGERIEIVHLVTDIKERMLGAITERRGPNDHSSGVASLTIDTVSCARRAPEGPQISEGVTQLRFGAWEREKQE
jgi:hypothetical protein